jgi:hypothetical protein
MSCLFFFFLTIPHIFGTGMKGVAKPKIFMDAFPEVGFLRFAFSRDRREGDVAGIPILYSGFALRGADVRGEDM